MRVRPNGRYSPSIIIGTWTIYSSKVKQRDSEKYRENKILLLFLFSETLHLFF